MGGYSKLFGNWVQARCGTQAGNVLNAISIGKESAKAEATSQKSAETYVAKVLRARQEASRGFAVTSDI